MSEKRIASCRFSSEEVYLACNKASRFSTPFLALSLAFLSANGCTPPLLPLIPFKDSKKPVFTSTVPPEEDWAGALAKSPAFAACTDA